jgi:hypothetical protein
MKNERKQDLQGPDEEALEEHVREMLDVTVPDPPEIPEVPDVTEPELSKPTKISVSSAEAEPVSAPKVPRKKATKKGAAIVVILN